MKSRLLRRIIGDTVFVVGSATVCALTAVHYPELTWVSVALVWGARIGYEIGRISQGRIELGKLESVQQLAD